MELANCFKKACIIALTVSSFAAANAQVDITREYKIKAAYVYNLIKFVDWPDKLLADSTAPINICVYKINPFSNYLDRLTKKKAKGRPIGVIYVDNSLETVNCHVMFVSPANKDLTDLFAQSKNKPILMIGEGSVFLDQGGIIGLIIDNNSIQLEINLTQAKKVGLDINGNLLELAKSIR